MPEVKCDQCGKIYKRSARIIMRNNNNFCSRECHKKYKAINGYIQKATATYHHRKLVLYAEARRRMRRSSQNQT